MNNQSKKKPASDPSPPANDRYPILSYAFTITREYPGWRTHLIELRGKVATILESTEPDTLLNAIFTGERWIKSKATH